jgi:hypothetical protein
MAFHDFSNDKLVVAVNGRQLTNWGENDPPFDHDYPSELGDMKKGLGGDAARLDLIEPGQMFNFYLMPGSPDSAFMSGLKNSRATITVAHSQLGTLEAGLGREGMMKNRQSIGRGGQSITDDIYSVLCNKYVGTTGGS